MKCPKCQNEVCNQRICPYCGGTVFLEESSLQMENLRYGNIAEQFPGRRENRDQEELLTKIGKIETKINLILIFSISQFFLMLLVLVLLCA